VQAKCLEHAHELLRRKNCPIEVRYEPGEGGPPQLKVSLYSLSDPLCAFPVGSISGLGGGTGGEGAARLAPGDACVLRPQGSADAFRMRIYRPAPFLDVVLHDGVEVRRGDRVVLVAEPNGGKVRCFAAGSFTGGAAGTGETVAAPPARVDAEQGGSGGVDAEVRRPSAADSP